MIDSNGLSWSVSYGTIVGTQEAIIVAKDAAVLRSLARQVAAIAAGDEQAGKRQLWLDHNSLRATRPLIFCDPEKAWYEIIPLDGLRYRGGLARI